MLASDSKLNIVTNIEYKIERLLGKQDDHLIILQTMAKLVENQPQAHDPLFGEFTARGVLSTLRIIERKIDKLQMQFSSSQSMLAKQILDNKRKTEEEEPRQRLQIKCNTPPKVEEMLSDVSSKVDVLFDKFTSSEENTESSNTEEQRDSAEITSVETKADPDIKLIRGLLKRLNLPCKRTVKVLETLESTIKTIDNTTITILDETQSSYNSLLKICQNNDKKIQTFATQTQSISNKLQDFITNISNNLIQEQEFVANQFYEQRKHIEQITQAINIQNVDNIKDNGTDIFLLVSIDDTENTTNAEGTSTESTLFGPTLLIAELGCEDIPSTESSGVYTFSRIDEIRYDTRNCLKDDKGFWTVIQSRGINPKEVNFSRSWNEYKRGFGSLYGDFWYGNDFIHKLTHEKDMVLRIELEDFDGNMTWAEFSVFKVLSEEEKYKLLIGMYNGNSSDAFSSHNNSKFSTYDQTNDNAPACCACAASYGGGWWFYR